MQINAQSLLLLDPAQRREPEAFGRSQGQGDGETTVKRFWIMGAMAGLSGCVDAPAQTGHEVYEANCAACHGADGRGEGIIAAELPVDSPDLTLLAAQNGGVFPTARVVEKIYGYPEDYPLQVMREFGSLLRGPAVRWADETGAEITTTRALRDVHDYLVSIQTE